MSSRSRKRIDATGRSEREPYVGLAHSFLDGKTWLRLSPGARAAYLEVERHYNGRNNGAIGLGVRGLAVRLGVNKDTANKWLKELQCRGFIKVAHGSSFDTSKGHLATTWTLTRHPVAPGQSPTKEYQGWRSPADDYPVFDGTASHQKARKRDKQQSQDSGPVVPRGRTEPPLRTGSTERRVPKKGTANRGDSGGSGPVEWDTFSLPSVGGDS